MRLHIQPLPSANPPVWLVFLPDAADGPSGLGCLVQKRMFHLIGLIVQSQPKNAPDQPAGSKRANSHQRSRLYDTRSSLHSVSKHPVMLALEASVCKFNAEEGLLFLLLAELNTRQSHHTRRETEWRGDRKQEERAKASKVQIVSLMMLGIED
ncbi:hypothetical protein PAAG_04479 [Paracoccidioides lutzii Pb01]|uniref:Uncharacterized protein n=1 Tax=Paracoccidioides lutzii (strain ATCC MYA-826 / Pb01) TaxID=502779 RepID=C1H135_PARBA|nr:hypothetical protein PAAG_04479 [Paracoccidioides lutzii Pb01]EEH33429.2 hypothetical protein PAAG_04479 [Paracoccidioides lutzii Pb01]